MSAKDIALKAYEQALAAVEAERLAEQARKAEEARLKEARHQEVFNAALPTLNSWFPGVDWTFEIDGDFGGDTIVYDAGENQYPPSFRLKIIRYLIDMNTPEAGYQIKFEVGDYVLDHQSGYHYFSGGTVKSPADIGRYLERKKR